jgi:ribosomal protein L32
MDEIEDDGETEERPPLIVECPHCHVRVLPLANNICPACRSDMWDLEDVDPNQVAFTIHESEELPSFCYSCDLYTERRIRVSADKESALETALFGLASPDKTTNVIIYLPQCDECGQWKEPERISTNYDHQTITILVHKGFRDRVLQLRNM